MAGNMSLLVCHRKGLLWNLSSMMSYEIGPGSSLRTCGSESPPFWLITHVVFMVRVKGGDRDRGGGEESKNQRTEDRCEKSCLDMIWLSHLGTQRSHIQEIKRANIWHRWGRWFLGPTTVSPSLSSIQSLESTKLKEGTDFRNSTLTSKIHT